jgi:hypothetical protein
LWALNDVLNLCMFHTGPDLRGDWILFMWTRPVVKLSKNLVLTLSIFSSEADSRGAEIIAATCGDSSSSIGELWPDIDK